MYLQAHAFEFYILSSDTHARTYTHAYTHTYIYIYTLPILIRSLPRDIMCPSGCQFWGATRPGAGSVRSQRSWEDFHYLCAHRICTTKFRQGVCWRRRCRERQRNPGRVLSPTHSSLAMGYRKRAPCPSSTAPRPQSCIYIYIYEEIKIVMCVF